MRQTHGWRRRKTFGEDLHYVLEHVVADSGFSAFEGVGPSTRGRIRQIEGILTEWGFGCSMAFWKDGRTTLRIAAPEYSGATRPSWRRIVNPDGTVTDRVGFHISDPQLARALLLELPTVPGHWKVARPRTF
jgi:hypothetical protein